MHTLDYYYKHNKIQLATYYWDAWQPTISHHNNASNIMLCMCMYIQTTHKYVHMYVCNIRTYVYTFINSFYIPCTCNNFIHIHTTIRLWRITKHCKYVKTFIHNTHTVHTCMYIWLHNIKSIHVSWIYGIMYHKIMCSVY